MSESHQASRESLSSLLDGEASAFESKRVPARMADDPALRETWARYQLVSAVLKAQPTGDLASSLKFADRVQRAIAEQQQEGVLQAAPALAAKRSWPRWAGQLTAAASCAAIAIGVTTWQMRESQTGAQVAEALNTAREVAPLQATVIANTAAPKLIDTPLLSPVSSRSERERLQWLEARPEVSPVNFALPAADKP